MKTKPSKPTDVDLNPNLLQSIRIEANRRKVTVSELVSEFLINGLAASDRNGPAVKEDLTIEGEKDLSLLKIMDTLDRSLTLGISARSKLSRLCRSVISEVEVGNGEDKDGEGQGTWVQ